MKKRTSTERYALILGVVFCVIGVFWLEQPPEGKFLHPSTYRFSQGLREHGAGVEELTETRGRLYGVMALMLGAGFSAMGLYRSKE